MTYCRHRRSNAHATDSAAAGYCASSCSCESVSPGTLLQSPSRTGNALRSLYVPPCVNPATWSPIAGSCSSAIFLPSFKICPDQSLPPLIVLGFIVFPISTHHQRLRRIFLLDGTYICSWSCSGQPRRPWREVPTRQFLGQEASEPFPCLQAVRRAHSSSGE